MQLSAPKKVVFYISLFLGVIGIVLHLAAIAGSLGFLMLVVGFVLLAIANILKGL